MKNSTNISCRKVEQWLLGEDSHITEVDQMLLKGHLATCSRCARLCESVTHQSDLLRQVLPNRERLVPGTLTARALARWDAEQRDQRTAIAFPFLRRSLLAGGLATMVAGVGLAGWWNQQLAEKPAVHVVREIPTFPRDHAWHRESTPVPVLWSQEKRVAKTDVGTAVHKANKRTYTPEALQPSPRVVAVRHPAVSTGQPFGDDQKYFAPDAKTFASRWTGLPDPEVAQLEAQIRASVRGGDDFVEVPFPRIAATDRAAVVDAIRSYKQEAEIVDSRLQRKVTLGVKRVSFAAICEKLSKETGVTFTAQKGVADDKITLFCKDRPARDLMRAIAHLFNYTWDRQGEEGAYSYRLKQPLQAQLLEEELRNKDRNDALLALDKEMDRYKNLLNLTPEEARARAESATGRDKEMLEAYGNTGWGPVNLYFGLSSDQMNTLRDGQPINFQGVSPEGVGAEVPGMLGFGGGKSSKPEPMSEQMSQQILEAMSRVARVYKDGLSINSNGFKPGTPGSPPAEVPGTAGQASLRLNASELGRFELLGGSGMSVGNGKGGSAMMSIPIAVGVSPSARDPKNSEANKALEDKPGMKDKVFFATKPESATTDEDDRITTADLLEAIHKATGRDVIGDYYTKLFDRKTVLPTGEAPLFNSLCRSCDAARLRWGAEDEWLTFRSVSFFNDRPKEVPNRLLERWQAAKQRNQGNLPASSVIEIAALSDVQLDAQGMAEGAKALYGLDEWETARSASLRPSWRLLADLGNGARQDALSKSGLGFTQMTLDQQQQFAKMAFGDSNSPEATQENLSAATLRVYYGPKPLKPTDTPVPVSVKTGVPTPAVKPEWTAQFVYRWKTKNGLKLRALTPRGTMAGDDSGKEPEIY